ncbi:hypothetical protein SK355_01365 [Candidatus Fukatsuia symbiotica]|uniref:Uncharacterized protein n=1 Tax=Candidatus Fukatsuia symbiotica TaxID=1878942 RepID=A0A2U8IAH8_9GAMM|nr:hypothetical protein [Candidatus Fukatsuia symbiotica]AWK15175.1 hypothetical protein CCS41_12960 [Candidatus Fukatsuia symbiotica]MEA9444002.1 hypothetical protein [Candidatus Fukatsuia symbiotica]
MKNRKKDKPPLYGLPRQNASGIIDVVIVNLYTPAHKVPRPSASQHIPFAFQVTAALAARTHPSHVLPVHSWDSIDCRLAVTRNSLG